MSEKKGRRFSFTSSSYIIPILISISTLISGYVYSSYSQSTELVDVSDNSNNSSTANKPIVNDYQYVILNPMDTSYTVNKPINISGNLKSVEKDKNLTNILVILEVSNGDNNIYKTILRTDSNGFFDTTFTPSITGTLKVNAYASNSSNTNSLRIFEVKGIIEDQILIILIFILILVAFLVIIFLRKNYISLVIGVVLVIIGYSILFFSSQNTLLNTILGTALFAPLITYIIEYIKKKNEEDAETNLTVTKYRDEYLREEEKVLIQILDEIAKHRTFFENKDNFNNKISFYLSTQKYNKLGVLHSTISNTPVIIIHNYYRHIDMVQLYYNAIKNKKGDLQHWSTLMRFKTRFNLIIEQYSKLNNLLYINILYNILEARINYLSFEKTKFPIRYTKPFLLALLKAELFGKINTEQENNEEKYILSEPANGFHQFKNREFTYTSAHDIEKLVESDKLFIYKRKTALKFMKYIHTNFYASFSIINNEISYLNAFRIK